MIRSHTLQHTSTRVHVQIHKVLLIWQRYKCRQAVLQFN